MDARKLGAEDLHALVHQDAARRGDGADGERAAEALPEVLEFPLRHRGHVEELGRPRGEQLAGLGQLDVVRATPEELEPDFVLEHLHLVAQRRLGHVQPPRGRCDLPLLHDRHEIAQLL